MHPIFLMRTSRLKLCILQLRCICPCREIRTTAGSHYKLGCGKSGVSWLRTGGNSAGLTPDVRLSTSVSSMPTRTLCTSLLGPEAGVWCEAGAGSERFGKSSMTSASVTAQGELKRLRRCTACVTAGGAVPGFAPKPPKARR